MGYTAKQAKAFIDMIAPLMQSESQRRGYSVCSTAIAQAIVEGAAGTSVLARQYHNHFGLKCGKSWKGDSVNLKTKEEYKVGTLTTIKDNFRVYRNDEEGAKGYYDFISTSRYANLKSAVTPEDYARMLKADGYATSSSYVNTLVSTVNKYELQKYDNIKTKICPVLRKGSKGEYVRAWQTLLCREGYDLIIDGVFGDRTQEVVMDWQSKHNLKPDGIIGPLTWAALG